MIKLFEEDYYQVKKSNKITDKYSFKCRMKCKVDGEDMTPEEYAKKNNIKLIPKNQRQINVKKCSLFPISRGIIILKFAAKLMNMKVTDLKWLDPSSGWGDRLISAIKADIKEYYGVDPSKCMNPNYNQIIKELGNKNKHQVKLSGFENHYIWKNDKKDRLKKFDIVFTSPPFYNKEVYENTKTQSIHNIKSGKEWFDKFFLEYVKNGFRHLKHNGVLVLYVEDHGEYSYINQLVKAIPYKYLGYVGITYTQDKNDPTKKIRPYHMWKKNSPNILLTKFLGTFGYDPKHDIIPKNKIKKTDKILFMLVGFPGSGKTTFIKNKLKKQLKNYVMINNDELLVNHPDFVPRKNYVHKNDNFIIFDKMFQVVLKYQLPFIYDSNCVNIEYCNEILHKFKNYKKIVYGIYSDKDIARKRIKDRAKKEGRFVPESFLNNSYKPLKEFIKHCNKLKPVDELLIYNNGKLIKNL